MLISWGARGGEVGASRGIQLVANSQAAKAWSKREITQQMVRSRIICLVSRRVSRASGYLRFSVVSRQHRTKQMLPESPKRSCLR